jgi:hypothetical protein
MLHGLALCGLLPSLVAAQADGRARRLVEGNDWQQDCRSANELRHLLVVTPKENDMWDFF